MVYRIVAISEGAGCIIERTLSLHSYIILVHMKWLKEGWLNVYGISFLFGFYCLKFWSHSRNENLDIIQWSAKKQIFETYILITAARSNRAFFFRFCFFYFYSETYTFDKDPLFYEWIQFELMLPTPIYAFCGVAFFLFPSKYTWLQFDSYRVRSNRSEQRNLIEKAFSIFFLFLCLMLWFFFFCGCKSKSVSIRKYSKLEIPSNIFKSHVIRFRKFSDGQQCIKHKSNSSLNYFRKQ